MISKLVPLLILSFVLTIHVYCQKSNQLMNQVKQIDTTKSSTDNFSKKIKELKEFKQEQKRIDSINKTSGTPVKLYIDIVDSSFLSEDKGKNISLAFVNEDYYYNHNQTMFFVKFDKDKQKI